VSKWLVAWFDPPLAPPQRGIPLLYGLGTCGMGLAHCKRTGKQNPCLNTSNPTPLARRTFRLTQGTDPYPYHPILDRLAGGSVPSALSVCATCSTAAGPPLTAPSKSSTPTATPTPTIGATPSPCPPAAPGRRPQAVGRALPQRG